MATTAQQTTRIGEVSFIDYFLIETASLLPRGLVEKESQPVGHWIPPALAGIRARKSNCPTFPCHDTVVLGTAGCQHRQRLFTVAGAAHLSRMQTLCFPFNDVHGHGRAHQNMASVVVNCP